MKLVKSSILGATASVAAPLAVASVLSFRAVWPVVSRRTRDLKWRIDAELAEWRRP